MHWWPVSTGPPQAGHALTSSSRIRIAQQAVMNTAQDILADTSALDRPILVDEGLPCVRPIDGKRMVSSGSPPPPRPRPPSTGPTQAFLAWRNVPAPVRGELVRLLGEQLRRHKEALGRLVTLETGKILSEGLGEVQEMIDICDFAVGLSRQLYGLTIASERPGHRMMETWHPAGVVGVISAFNFPVAVWSWNTRARPGLRRQRGLEAVGEDAADRPRLPGPARPGAGALRRIASRHRARRTACGPDGWPRDRRGARPLAAGGGGQRNRQHPHGPQRRRCRSPNASAARSSSSAATTR